MAMGPTLHGRYAENFKQITADGYDKGLIQ